MTPLKQIRFGKHTLSSPTLFASYRMGDFPIAGLKFHPWEITETEALLINAYDFMRRKYQPVINNGWSPSRDLDFADKPILVDSGAYYFVRKNNVTVTPSDVLSIQLKTKADVGVVLDHPFPPEAKDKAKRIKTTLKNTEAVLLKHSAASNMSILPVVHGHTTRSIKSCISRLREMHPRLGYGDLTQVGIGSVAPLAQRKRLRLASEIIRTVRKELPDAYIHCFSMGSALSMLLAFYSGADTVDSQSWIVSAAFKNAQLSGHYVKRMGRREYASIEDFESSMRAFAERLRRLSDEEGFRVKDWMSGEEKQLLTPTDFLDYTYTLVDTESNENIHNRACHNLWVYNFEVKKYREALGANDVDNFVKGRLKATQYESVLASIQQASKRGSKKSPAA